MQAAVGLFSVEQVAVGRTKQYKQTKQLVRPAKSFAGSPNRRCQGRVRTCPFRNSSRLYCDLITKNDFVCRRINSGFSKKAKIAPTTCPYVSQVWHKNTGVQGKQNANIKGADLVLGINACQQVLRCRRGRRCRKCEDALVAFRADAFLHSLHWKCLGCPLPDWIMQCKPRLQNYAQIAGLDVREPLTMT